MLANSSLAGTKAQRDEDDGGVLWGGHAAADQGPVCWSLDYHWTPSYIYIIRSGLRTIFLVPHLLEHNYC